MSPRAAVAAALAALAVPSAARAQAAVERAWALDRFDPAPQGDGFLLAEHPRYARAWGLSAGVTMETAASPLVLQRQYADTHSERASVVSSMFVAHAGVSASFAGRAGVDFVLPVSLVQTGDDAALGTVVIAPTSGPSVGDARLGGRVRVVGRAGRDPFSLHVGAWVWLPTGSRAGNTGDGALRVEPRVIMAGAAGIVRWSFVTAVMFRPSVDALNVAVGTELRLTGAIGFDLLRGRLRVGPEAYVVTPIRSVPDGTASAAFADGQWGAEALVSAHYAVIDGLVMGAGVGAGFQRAVGVPAARFALSFTWRGPRAGNAAPTIVGE